MKYIVFILALIVLLTVACHAEDEQPLKMSLSDAVMKALDINASIKQAEAAQFSSLSNLRIARQNTSYGIGSLTNFGRNSDFARLSTRAYGNFTYESPFGTEASVDFSPLGFGDEHGSISLTLRKPLWAGSGKLSKKYDTLAGAKSSATIQEKQLYLTRQATVVTVVETYFRAVLEREQVKVHESALKVAEESAIGAKKRSDAGLVSGIEVSRAEIQVARTKDQLNLQKQSARAAMDRLMSAIGAGVGREPDLTDEVPEPPTDIPDLAEAVKTALANRVELVVFDEQLSNQIRRVAIAEDGMKPRLDVVAGFNSANDDSGILSHQMIEAGNFHAGLQYSIPLDKRITRENRATAARDLDVMRSLRVFQMENVTEEVRNAYRNLNTSQTSLRIFSENVKVAEDNLSLALRMVEEGIDDNRVVLEAQDSLTQVKSGLLSAKVDLYLAAINLRYAMGQDLTDVVIK